MFPKSRTDRATVRDTSDDEVERQEERIRPEVVREIAADAARRDPRQRHRREHHRRERRRGGEARRRPMDAGQEAREVRAGDVEEQAAGEGDEAGLRAPGDLPHHAVEPLDGEDGEGRERALRPPRHGVPERQRRGNQDGRDADRGEHRRRHRDGAQVEGDRFPEDAHVHAVHLRPRPSACQASTPPTSTPAVSRISVKRTPVPSRASR